MKPTVRDRKVERKAARARRIEANSFYFYLHFFFFDAGSLYIVLTVLEFVL